MEIEKKEPVDWKIVVAAIFAITAICIVCVLNGINGTVLAICTGLIGTLAGLNLPQLKVKVH